VIHFIVLGAGIFALAPRPTGPRTIHIDGARLAALGAEQASRLGVAALSPQQARAVRTRAIEDELLVREAQRLGLDENDTIVRQRLAQKVLFLAEDLGGASRDPSDAEIRRLFAANRASYRAPESLRLVHVFASTRERAESLRPAVVAWSKSARTDAVPPLGEPLPVSRSVVARLPELVAMYGESFVASVRQLPVGSWSQPIASLRGWHLVRVSEHQLERPASYEETRERLRLDWLIARRQEAVERYLRAALARWRVDVDGKPVRVLDRSRRVAVRSESSGED
jgi:hypothetical protein